MNCESGGHSAGLASTGLHGAESGDVAVVGRGTHPEDQPGVQVAPAHLARQFDAPRLVRPRHRCDPMPRADQDAARQPEQKSAAQRIHIATGYREGIVNRHEERDAGPERRMGVEPTTTSLEG